MATRTRGPHPADAEAFADGQHAVLQRAVEELSWLLTRGYAPPSALKLVGDRYQLRQRQRLAVGQAACSDPQRDGRTARQVAAGALAGRAVRIDAFNVIITLEAALSGAVLLEGRDGAVRDLSRLGGGSYRLVTHTPDVIARVGALLAEARSGPVEWCLDRPKSNSGRLRGLIEHIGAERAWPWTARLTDHTDREVAAAPDVAASSDSWILDHAPRWVDLPAAVLAAAGDAMAIWLVPSDT